MQFPTEHVPITREDVVTFHSRKSVLYNDGELWVKKESSSLDVTMGAYDRAKVFNLLAFMLHMTVKKYNSKNIGLS